MRKNPTAYGLLLAGALLLTAGATLAQTAPAAGSAAAPATTATASVGQAQFTTGVANRAPADDITRLDTRHHQVFFFSVLKDAAGQTVTHRWQYQGKTVAEVNFEPKANHWRVWSSKTLMPDQTGTWTVEVVDASGNVLLSKSFDYTPAPAGQAEPSVPRQQNTATPASAAASQATPPTA